MRVTLGLVATAALIAAASGCAIGGEDQQDGLTLHKDSGHDSAIDDTGSGAKDTGAGVDTGAAFDTGSPDTGSLDTGSPDTAADTGSPDTVSDPCSVLGAAECASSAEVMSSISGDTGAGVATRTGSDAAWFRVVITEDDASVLSTKALSVRITLDSPPGVNFDLFVYKGKAKGAGGTIECTAVSASSISKSTTDAVALSWPDNHPIGGFDDSTPISIEVRPADASCPASAKWVLKIEGNK